ncbi:MAG: nicotinate-nucleotide diphosphorylase (carboxylating), partial [Candidatus Marinimicrobia bacterium]|nr:nicotinate-nucleotide diphosphorylase (carboxylating) [Candidatus Neomarinimicrobiota bacterium]
QIREAVATEHGDILLEASGNISLETVGGIARCGVDIISVGALTHSVKCLDLSLLFHV